MLHIDSDPIGTGEERDSYIHPHDPGKCVKVCKTEKRLQTKREVAYLKKLRRRKDFSWIHVPRFFEKVSTNKGPGMVVGLVRDYDGKISKTLRHYLSAGLSIDHFRSDLSQLKAYLLKYCVIFNYDMSEDNLLYQRLDKEEGRLVVIDGIGDTVFVPFLNYFKGHVRRKILRRWERFENKLYKHNDTLNRN
jgi:hypothetical protein